MTTIEQIMIQKKELAQELGLAPNETCGRSLLDLRLMRYVKQGGDDPRPVVEQIDAIEEEKDTPQAIIPEPPKKSELPKGYVEWRDFPYEHGFFVGTTTKKPPSELVVGMEYWTAWRIPKEIKIEVDLSLKEQKRLVLNELPSHFCNLLFFSFVDSQSCWTWVPMEDRPDWIGFMNRG